MLKIKNDQGKVIMTEADDGALSFTENSQSQELKIQIEEALKEKE